MAVFSYVMWYREPSYLDKQRNLITDSLWRQNMVASVYTRKFEQVSHIVVQVWLLNMLSNKAKACLSLLKSVKNVQEGIRNSWRRNNQHEFKEGKGPNLGKQGACGIWREERRHEEKCEEKK
jgi:hypothetical protein